MTTAETEAGPSPHYRALYQVLHVMSLGKGDFTASFRSQVYMRLNTSHWSPDKRGVPDQRKPSNAKWHQCYSKGLQWKISTAITFMRAEPSLLHQSVPHLLVCPKGLPSYSVTWLLIIRFRKNNHTHTRPYTKGCHTEKRRAYFLFISFFSQKS